MTGSCRREEKRPPEGQEVTEGTQPRHLPSLTNHPVQLLHIVPVHTVLAPPPEVWLRHQRDVCVQEGHEEQEGLVPMPGGGRGAVTLWWDRGPGAPA